jgi:thiamine biosynthesis lipoprotein
MEIDLGGIAKGYAVMRAAAVLKRHGIRNALISLGSSSVAALGSPPGEEGWRLFIRDPVQSSRSAGSLILHDGEYLATSGTYEHTKGDGQLRRSHIIDPATGQAISGSRSATVVSRDGELADAIAKPFLLLKSGSGEVSSLLKKWPGTSVILLYGDEPGPRAIVAGPAGDSVRLGEVWRAGIRVSAGQSRSSH